MKHIYTKIILLIILMGNLTYAQNLGSLSGRIVYSDGIPVENINIAIEGTTRGTVSNEQGMFRLDNLKEDNYNLIISFIGMETVKVDAKVESNKNINIGVITLQESSIELQELVISAERLNQFAQKESDYISRIPIKNIDNPQSYSVVTSALLREQVTTDLPSAFKSVTGGGYVQSNDGNVSVYLRGFRSDVHLRNGGIAWIKAPIDPQNIERLELVKGPAALLYGSNVNNIANYGGVVNKVTKEAYNGKKLDLEFIAGSWEQTRATLDFNAILDNDEKVYFRLNGAYNSENSFQDQGIIREFMIAPTLTANISEKFKLTVNMEYNESKRNLNFARGVSGALVSDNINSWDDLNWDYNTNYGSNEMAGSFSSNVLQAMAEYKITDSWTSKTTFTGTKLFTDANYLRLVMGTVDTLNRFYLQLDPRESGSTHLQQDFLHIIDTKNYDNKLVVGAGYLNNYDDTQRTGVWNSVGAVDVNNPTFAGLTNEQFEASISGSTKNKTISRFETLGFYAFDAITWQDRITLTAGVRFDRYMGQNTIRNGVELNDGYNQNAISTKFGMAYKPFGEQAAVFASYMDGLSNNAPSDNGTGEIIKWDAERAKQWEVGAKFDFFNEKLKSTISYYNIKIDNNIIMNENGISVQEGETLSKGFEIDLIANPLPGLNFVAGYTKNNATLEKVSNGSEGIIGNSLPYTPETVWNFWISYQVLKGNLSGIGIGFGGNHISEIYNSTQNNFGSEASTIFDALLYYKRDNYKLSAKIDNIFNEEYYNGYGIPQKPLNLRVGIAYSIF